MHSGGHGPKGPAHGIVAKSLPEARCVAYTSTGPIGWSTRTWSTFPERAEEVEDLVGEERVAREDHLVVDRVRRVVRARVRHRARVREERREDVGVLVRGGEVEHLLEREHVGTAARDDEVTNERHAVRAPAAGGLRRTEDAVEHVQARDGHVGIEARRGRGRAQRAIVAHGVRADAAAERGAPARGGDAELDGERAGLRTLEAAGERAAALDRDLAGALSRRDRDGADPLCARALVAVAPPLLRPVAADRRPEAGRQRDLRVALARTARHEHA
jgi:hypothetical protein